MDGNRLDKYPGFIYRLTASCLTSTVFPGDMETVIFFIEDCCVP